MKSQKEEDSANTEEQEELRRKHEFEEKKKLFVLKNSGPVRKPKSQEPHLISKILKDINKLGLERKQFFPFFSL